VGIGKGLCIVSTLQVPALTFLRDRLGSRGNCGFYRHPAEHVTLCAHIQTYDVKCGFPDNEVLTSNRDRMSQAFAERYVNSNKNKCTFTLLLGMWGAPQSPHRRPVR
jgi:hypothetical protein